MTLARLLRIGHQRARSLFFARAVDEEASQEIAFHFDQLVAEAVADGCTPGAARLRAQRLLGSSSNIGDECRDARGARWLIDTWRDMLHGARLLRASPGFALVAATSLALGIGTHGAIVTGIQRVLSDPLPFANSD